jgi:hypothetical protein
VAVEPLKKKKDKIKQEAGENCIMKSFMTISLMILIIFGNE